MGLEKEERVYEEVPDYSALIALLDEYLEEYNANEASQMKLVFFQDAVEHVTRVSRILRQPRGNAMLVGVGGSGKQSLTRFAAHMGMFKCVSIELARNYGITEFREDLKKLYRQVHISVFCCSQYISQVTPKIIDFIFTDVLRFIGMVGGPQSGRYIEFPIKRNDQN